MNHDESLIMIQYCYNKQSDARDLLLGPYLLMLSILIPIYYQNYGILNFLFFCDVALILTFCGILLKSQLLISMCAVGILGPQVIWIADLAIQLLGMPLVGFTAYMLDPEYPLVLRLLSLFHLWLPLLLVYLVRRYGYDARAFYCWPLLAIPILIVSFILTEPPRKTVQGELTPININYVWGLSSTEPQSLMSPMWWLVCLTAGGTIFICLPTHLALMIIAEVQVQAQR